MRIVYQVSVDDVVESGQHFVDTSAALRRMRIVQNVLVVLATIIACGYAAMVFSSPWPIVFLVIFVVVLLFLTPSLQRDQRRKAIQRVHASAGDNGEIGRHEMEVHDWGIVEKTRFRESRLHWPAVLDVASNDTHTFVYTEPGGGYSIARSAVLEGNYLTFTAELKQRFQLRGGSSAAEPTTGPSSDHIPAQPIATARPVPRLLSSSPGAAGTVTTAVVAAPKSSKLGTASFVIAICLFVACPLAIGIVSNMIGSPPPEEATSENLPLALAIVGCVVGSFLLALLGLLLGISGALEKNARKGLAVPGIVLNALIAGGLILMITVAVLSA
jgi:hypothetical protein